MKMKSKKIEYQNVEIEVMHLSTTDVITTSNDGAFDGSPEPFNIF